MLPGGGATAVKSPIASHIDSAFGHRRTFEVDPALSEAEHSASVRLQWALRSVAEEWGLDGLAIHFMAVDEEGRLETLPFLAASEMLADGYVYGGEGDVTSAVAGAMMHEMGGMANFTEMFTMDFDANAIVMSHMGEGTAEPVPPLRMPTHLKAIVGANTGCVYDIDQGMMRPATHQDMYDFIKVKRRLEGVGVSTSGVFPQDVPQDVKSVYATAGAVKYCENPGSHDVQGLDDLPWVARVMQAAGRGGLGNTRP